ncbi:hypothetical protein [Evansella cellulosilytica]|uniref:Uncharacterized protein n=1 Tax=Evansella cellulosilytica (strain ATCC 21833 / DSM 2522 / FERM P-1141 / JCM 9156 / N-4) TaxID=649639 RepID=E6U2C2_EVAC2|nr:hypothetical protein [Evansella cellulosilytica]ADU31635.1 hypothetical protein Bcell_3393 [Evansella cellulosilytica DSM 2522]
MRDHTFKRMLFGLFLIILTVIVYLSPKGINEEEVYAHIHEVVYTVEGLYGSHEKSNGKFYNSRITDIEDVKKLLGPFMNNQATNKVINEIFDLKDNQLIYNDCFQEYLIGVRENQFSSHPYGDFYAIIQNSILNPALKLLLYDELRIIEDGEYIIAKGDNMLVQFYDEDNGSYHYERLGYPPKEEICVEFRFIKENGQLVLIDYEIEGNAFVSL